MGQGRRTAAFEARYPFRFDDFQRRACEALEDGASVLVAAPTGAGKTVVGEFAAWLATQAGGKTFYTTPIKALSNQKYGDFVAVYGPSNVGLLTGDNSLNPEAPVVVMTTEVLRNMLYEDSPLLEGLHHVVLDEVHYLQDRYRGAVWEEIFIHLPREVLTVSLSATVSNTDEFAEWQRTLRGRVEVVVEHRRPVDIVHWYLVDDELLPMFVEGRDGRTVPNPRVRELERRGRHGPRQRGRRTRLPRPPARTEVVDLLAGRDMLPAIYFIFSRKGCDAAVEQCLRAGVRLTNRDERRRIKRVAEERTADLTDAELEVLGYDTWMAGLLEGVAAHHAGMIPPFKETVEDLFAAGLIKVVFATETLALGINMPARSVVIESLVKFTGEEHELMTPGEYTQLTGRAGRRGKDELGHAVVLVQRYTPFETVARLASTRTYPLVSSFQPSYNMAVNLVRNYDRADAEHLVNSSFAQFQADREIVHLETTLERQRAYLASYRERMRCERGDVEEYRRLSDALVGRSSRVAGRRQADAVAAAMMTLRPGDVVVATSGRRRGAYAVLEVSRRKSERRPRALALSDERALVRLAPQDFDSPPRPLARVELPPGFHVRDARARRQVARALARLSPPEPPARELAPSVDDAEARRALEAHPVHSCPERDRHLHFAKRAASLEKEVARLERRIHRRSATLARRFQQVLDVLERLDYVRDWSLTPKGERLTKVYNEADLLVVEALELGVPAGLDPAELAGLFSTLVYETRGPEQPPFEGMPTDGLQRAWEELHALFEKIRGVEQECGVELLRAPDPSFADKAYAWAGGWPLDEVLDEEDAPGDFVRSIKQLIDLLRQLVDVVPDPALRAAIDEAVHSLHRGVVAYSSLEV